MAAISAEVRATTTGVAGFATVVGAAATGVPSLSAAAADARAIPVKTAAGAWPTSPGSAVISALVRVIATAAQVIRAEVAVVATPA